MDQAVAQQKHQQFVAQLRAAHGCFSSPELSDAFESVPRHLFLPGLALEEVYSDKAIMTAMGNGKGRSSCSQPSFIALMASMVGASTGKRILEIGSGTGYTATILSRLVGPAGRVVSVDIDDDLVEMAQRNLAGFGFETQTTEDGNEWFRKPGFGNIAVRCQDGFQPVTVLDRYDGIVVTASGTDIAGSWITQLEEEGRLVAPVRLLPGLQILVAFRKQQGRLLSRDIRACSAVALRGELSDDNADWPQFQIEVTGAESGGQAEETVFQRKHTRMVVTRQAAACK